ncbi:MAG: Gfo/Idh/MocA family protein [Candidatus Nanohaloarchaea archaeon]
MSELKVYQIGLGSFGRYGFEKLVELQKHFDRVDVTLKGVCDPDPERLERAEKFGERNDVEFETFRRAEELYGHAENEEGNIMVYDAGPTETHPRFIKESLRHGFFHLAEKPPSLEREKHLAEKKLAEQNNVMWKVDFIERENPVVQKTLEILKDERIDSIEVFRESSVGVQKLLDPVTRSGVKGGDILDKMVHEVYVLDFLEEVGENMEMELESAEARYFMPRGFNTDKLMSVDGGPKKEIDGKTATARTSATFTAGDAEIRLNSSWIGLSERARIESSKIRQLFDESLLDRGYQSIDEKAFLYEESRFFVINGSRDLVGDMLHQKLYDLDAGEEIEVPGLLHDQLYRVIENAVLNAAGKKSETLSRKETDIFMNAIFDVKDAVVDSAGDFYDELDSARQELGELVIEDNKILEPEESETIAG